MHTSGSTLTGTIDGVTIANGQASGNVIHFDVPSNGVTLNYKGTITGDQLSLHEGHVGGTHHGYTFSRGN